jgi:hypothetical protein
MAKHIDTNKPPQGLGNSITPDWTSLNNQSDPYYLKAENKIVNGEELNLEERYVVTVVTDYKSPGKTREDLANRLKKQSNIEKGFVRILNFYDKNPGESQKRKELLNNAIVEGWFINPRPNSRLKILVSIATRHIDPLPGIVESNIGLDTAAYKVTFQQGELSKKVKSVIRMLDKYDAETRNLSGRIPGLSFKSQSKKMTQVIPSLGKLMLDNKYDFNTFSDQEIIFGMTADYQPSYVLIRDNECFKPLDKNFDNFRKSIAFSDSRTNKLLNNIDKLNELYKNLDNITMQDFVNEYIYNPPSFDFSTAQAFSEPEVVDVKKQKEKMNEKTAKTYADYTLAERTIETKEFKEKLGKNLESASEFVGDNIIGGLRELSNLVPSVNSLYSDILNKVPIRDLIEAALECLNFRGLEFLDLSKQFLNQAASLAEDIKTAIFDIPSIYLKDDLPITDYLEGIYESIKNGIIQSLVSTLFRMVREIIRMLLDFCKECALENEAAGRGRFDGFNFGGMSIGNVLGAGAQTFTAAAVGSIATGLTSTRFPVPGGGSTSVAEQQQKVIASTERYAKNPLLMPGELELFHDHRGVKDNVGDEKLQKELTDQANQAKQEMSGFLDAASSVLTPAEAANMMLGCGTGQEAIDAVKNLASTFPTISPLIQSDDDVLGFFNDIGKLTGYPTVLQTVKEITDRLPQEFLCLCDPDDTAIRENLLSKKEMDPELINEQVTASKAREQKRLEELNALLQKNNILDGLVPQIYCSYDPKTGTTNPGLISRDHPKFTFTLEQTLNTLYDSVATTFNRDIESFLPTVTIAPAIERVVPRTVERVINNEPTTLFNNEFLDLVGKGQYSFGSLPPGVTDQQNNKLENGQTYGQDSDRFTNINWLGSKDIDEKFGTDNSEKSAEDLVNDGAAIGMSQPFPEAEREYELRNINPDFFDSTTSGYRKSISGRADPNGFFTRKYGYSPVPIIVKERGQEAFAPGFKEAYRTFCYSEPGLNKLTIAPFEQNSKRFKFDVPNKLLDNLNIDLEALKGSAGGKQIDSTFFTPEDTGGRLSEAEIGEGFQDALSGLFGKINNLGFSLNYYVPYQWQNNGTASLDQFTFVVAADTPEAFVEEAGGPEQLELNAIVSGPNETINPKAVNCYENRSLVPANNSTQNKTPQEMFFSRLIDDSVNNGPVTYSGTTRTQNSFITSAGAGVNNVIDIDRKADLDYYNEVWKDIFCSFTNQISSESNPFFDLSNLSALDFIPMKTENQECAPHLLDIDAVKNRIQKEYSVIQCLEASFPNTNGLGTNKDNPFEKANLSGTILLILRTYITELFLRSLQAFYWFRYKTPADVDSLMVLYVGRYITSDIEKQGYFSEFEKEVLDLYNRNVDLKIDEEGNPIPETDYDTAIKFLVRQQIWSVANRMSRLVGSQGDTSLDAIVLEEWIRMVQIQKTESEARLNKPCVPASSDMPFVSQQLLDILSNEGGLGISGIKRISDFTYSGPTGFLFREYFGSNPNMPEIRGVPSPDDIWSINLDLGGTPLQRIAGSSLSELVNGGSVDVYSASKVNDNREAYMLLSSGLVRATGFNPENWNWNFLKNNWENLEDMLTYRIDVSEAEKTAMSTVIKFTAATAAPKVFNESSVGNIGSKNINGIDYYPGYYLKKSLNSRSIGDYRTNFITINIGDEFENTFDIKYMPTYGVEYDSTNRELGNSYILNDYFYHLNPGSNGWSPKPNTVGGSTITGRELNNYFFDKTQAAFISLWQNEDNPSKTGLTDLGGSLPNINGTDIINDYTKDSEWVRPFARSSVGFPQYTDEPNLEIYLANNQYVVVGKTTNENDVLIENFYPRTLVDWLGNRHTFRSEYVLPRRSRSEVNIDFQDAADHWTYSPIRQQDGTRFYLPPEYTQYTRNTGNQLLEEEVIITNFPPQALNPSGNRGSFHERLFYHTAYHIKSPVSSLGGIPYFSLLDLDPLSIVQVLNWEKEQASNDPNTTYAAKQLLMTKYDQWISEYNKAYQTFLSTERERLEKRRELSNRIGETPPARRPMETPLTCNYENGGLLLEPYIRSVPLDVDPNSLANENVSSAGLSKKILNKQIIDDKVDLNEWGRTGIVNIDEFDELLVGISNSGNQVERVDRTAEETLADACGENLNTRLPRNYEYDGNTLGDFFEEVHLGLRISYVMPIKEGTTSNIVDQDPQYPFLGNIWDNRTKEQKAYMIKERDGNNERTLNIIPISSVEIPFNMRTRMEDVTATYPDEIIPQVDQNGFLINQTPTDSRFFKSVYKRNLKNLVRQMNQTEDYSLMFKYLFPIDKMLSINTIYSSTYLSTMRNIDTVFDATKEELRQLLFILLDSGNYEASRCAPSNREFMENLLNGFDVKGLAGQIAVILLKSSVLIFKGFMEAADINILLSRRIVDLIHTVNQFIAQSQQLINQAAQAAVDTATGISDLATSIYDPASDFFNGTSCRDLLGPGSCKTSSKVNPSRPDISLFEPIEENFIPEPQIWAVSLALLPATLFAPFFFGPPLTLPFGFVYWALDYKPSPNWLNATPPQDWINKLLNEQGKTKGAPYNPAQPNENCNADLGLPSPELNAVKLNDYYSQQNPAPTDPSSGQITGDSGTADSSVTGVNFDSVSRSTDPNTGKEEDPSNDPSSAENPDINESSESGTSSWGSSETTNENETNPFAGGIFAQGDDSD